VDDLLDGVGQLDAAPLTHVTQSVESLLGDTPVSSMGMLIAMPIRLLATSARCTTTTTARSVRARSLLSQLTGSHGGPP
jgi:hypothetical protein